MPRTPLTPGARAFNVKVAAQELPGALQAAQAATQAHGDSDPRTRRAWEIVENLGATVHRQSRILAGKSRGG